MLVWAVRRFVQTEGCLPLSGTVPDMHADTDSYVRMQNVYRTKARHDVDTVKTHLATILEAIGRPADHIPHEEVERFCRNASCLKVLRYRPLREEYDGIRKGFLKRSDVGK